MSFLPNYLYNQIIKLILDYLLIYNKKKYNDISNKEHYSIKRFTLYSNELNGYSLVSKYWYTSISKVLSNNIIDNEIIEYWFNPKTIIKKRNDSNGSKYTKGLHDMEIEMQDKWVIKFTSLIMNVNMEFSMVKINDEILNQYFGSKYLLISSHPQYNDYSSLLPLGNFKKVENNISDPLDIYNLLLSSDQIPNGHEINILEDVMYQITIREPNKVVAKSVNKLVFSNSYDTFDHSCIANFQPKQFLHKFQNYFPESDYNHLNYSPIFDPVFNCNIESIKIHEFDSVEPSHLLKINQLQNLHSCSIPISFHGIIENQFSDWVGTGCEYNLGSFNGTEKCCYNDWITFISLLCENVVLKNLTLKNICSNYLHAHINSVLDNGISQETINNSITNVSNSIHRLLSSSKNNIVYLKFVNLDFINQFDKTFSPLQHNKSIKTFVYKRMVSCFNIVEEIKEVESILYYLISNVFTNNSSSSVLHFKFQLDSKKIFVETSCTIVDFIFNLLQENISQLNLYSIGLSILKSQLDTVFSNKLFSKLSTTTKLKEINLKIQNISLKDKLEIRKNLELFRISNANNFIINIV